MVSDKGRATASDWKVVILQVVGWSHAPPSRSLPPALGLARGTGCHSACRQPQGGSRPVDGTPGGPIPGPGSSDAGTGEPPAPACAAAVPTRGAHLAECLALPRLADGAPGTGRLVPGSTRGRASAGDGQCTLWAVGDLHRGPGLAPAGLDRGLAGIALSVAQRPVHACGLCLAG